MNDIIQNHEVAHGFKPSIIDETHWVYGESNLEAEVLQPDGDWSAFLPPDEEQRKNGLETYNCTSYGTLHALAILGRKLFGAKFQNNLSERFLGRVAGTTIYGNDPHKVSEAVRNVGVIPEVYLPFNDSIKTWQQYYIKIIPYWLWMTGQHWIKTYKFNHDWVFLPSDSQAVRQTLMAEALKHSPLGASGYAWSLHTDNLYHSDGLPNHWFTIYGCIEGVKWLIFDSYNNTHKELAWDYSFGQVKRYSLTKNLGGETANINPLGYVPFYLTSLIS